MNRSVSQQSATTHWRWELIFLKYCKLKQWMLIEILIFSSLKRYLHHMLGRNILQQVPYLHYTKSSTIQILNNKHESLTCNIDFTKLHNIKDNNFSRILCHNRTFHAQKLSVLFIRKQSLKLRSFTKDTLNKILKCKVTLCFCICITDH